MPSRLFTAAILIFWLGMTAWLIQREVVPMMLADLSPTYKPDLADEIGSKEAFWMIHHNGKRVGSARSRVNALPDRTFELHSYLTFKFEQKILDKLDEIDCLEQMDEEGRLQALAVKVLFDGQVLEVRGKVVDNELAPRFFIDGREEKLLPLGKIEMSTQRSMQNPLRLANRLRGLHDGRTWTVPQVNPLQGLEKLLGRFKTPSELIARVSIDTLTWDQKEVECYKVEYHEAGEDPIAYTWVRKSDDWVLKQQVSALRTELVFTRK